MGESGAVSGGDAIRPYLSTYWFAAAGAGVSLFMVPFLTLRTQGNMPVPKPGAESESEGEADGVASGSGSGAASRSQLRASGSEVMGGAGLRPPVDAESDMAGRSRFHSGSDAGLGV